MFGLLLAVAIAIPQTGRVVLPPGIVTVATEIRIPDGAHDLVVTANPRGTTLRATAGFKGRAVLACEGGKNIRFVGFAIDGPRNATRAGLPPSNVSFASFYNNNG